HSGAVGSLHQEAPMSERRHKNVVNIDEVAAREESHGGFGFSVRRLGADAGGRAVGCSHFEIPPGKTAFPFHFHSNLEEAVYILEGTATVRIGDAKIEVRAGDYIAMPAGPETAHAVTNSGDTTRRSLTIPGPATPVTLDVVVYPDWKRVAYATGIDPTKGIRAPVWIRGLHKEQPPTDYSLDEPLAKK